MVKFDAASVKRGFFYFTTAIFILPMYMFAMLSNVFGWVSMFIASAINELSMWAGVKMSVVAKQVPIDNEDQGESDYEE